MGGRKSAAKPVTATAVAAAPLATPEPTPREKAAMAALVERQQAMPHPARIKVSEGKGVPRVEPDHPDPLTGYALLMEALGTDDWDMVDGLLSQLVNIGTHGQKPDARGINFMLAIVKGIAPRDPVEAMLAAQMAAVHASTMTFARRLAHVDNLPQQDSAERAFNKLARTFAMQVEALKRHRSGGEQRMRIEHVTVHEGGQAIVGNVSAGGRGRLEKAEPTP